MLFADQAAFGVTLTNDLSEGLIAHWPLIGSPARDLTTNAGNGIAHDVLLQPDRFRNEYAAYGFNGRTSFVEIGATVKPPFPATVAAWVKAATRGGEHVIFKNDWDYSGEVFYGLWLKTDNNGFVVAGFGQGDSDRKYKEYHSAETLGTNEWHHLVGLFRDSNPPEIQLYIDGVPTQGGYFDTHLSGLGKWDTRRGGGQSVHISGLRMYLLRSAGQLPTFVFMTDS